MRRLGDLVRLGDLSSMRLLVLAALVAAACSFPTTTLAGQGPDRPLIPAPSADTVVASRAKPLNYFFRSLLLPGWGQASLDRKLTGGLFMAFEGLALGMALKAHAELGYLERVESERIDDKRRERQDWFVLMGVNHLFSGLEAFVSANLFDFPGDLTARALPGGRTGYGLALPMPR